MNHPITTYTDLLIQIKTHSHEYASQLYQMNSVECFAWLRHFTVLVILARMFHPNTISFLNCRLFFKYCHIYHHQCACKSMLKMHFSIIWWIFHGIQIRFLKYAIECIYNWNQIIESFLFRSKLHSFQMHLLLLS